MSEPLSRREFIGTTAVGAGAFLLAGQVVGQRAAAAGAAAATDLPRVKINRVYVGKPGTAWPLPKFDVRAEADKFEKFLAGIQPKIDGVEFVGGDIVQSPAQAAELAGKLKNADGILLFHLSLNTLPEMQQIVDAGRPTVVYSQPFSGHEWMIIKQWEKAGKKVLLLATSDMNEITQAVRLLRVPASMARSRVVSVPGKLEGSDKARSAEAIKAKLGTEVVPVSYQQIIESHQAVDPAAAEAEAEQYWLRPAKKIVEPSREEIIKSARMYLAMKAIMDAERAQAITIDCLGGLPIDKLGYPCLAFARLDDLGLVGACESDIDSTLTKLMFTYAFGKPGFISDPLFDTSKNAVIHAHCTAPTKMDGPAGERAPFMIRTHRDNDKGASLEVEMRVGQAITCAKLVDLDTLLVSTGKIIEIPDFEDRGCRTQITTEVADARKMLDNWGAGMLDKGWMAQLHRVVFYGDHLRPTKDLAALMGLKVAEAI